MYNVHQLPEITPPSKKVSAKKFDWILSASPKARAFSGSFCANYPFSSPEKALKIDQKNSPLLPLSDTLPVSLSARYQQNSLPLPLPPSPPCPPPSPALPLPLKTWLAWGSTSIGKKRELCGGELEGDRQKILHWWCECRHMEKMYIFGSCPSLLRVIFMLKFVCKS